jgi:hypothetical protein
MGREGKHTKSWQGNLENYHMEDQEGDESITLRQITGKWVVRMGDGWN